VPDTPSVGGRILEVRYTLYIASIQIFSYVNERFQRGLNN
jgi:hypothetical protein